MTVVRAAIIGVTGRMGVELVKAAFKSPSISIAAAVASAQSPSLGKDVGELAGLAKSGVRVTSDVTSAVRTADVVIDFSSAQATQNNLTACREALKPLLIGTTGFASDLLGAFDSAARDIPLLVAPNTSLGVALLIELVRQSASALPPEFDIEIIEAHHRMKRDSPSGTALALGHAAAEGRDLPSVGPDALGRKDGMPRQGGEIGYAVVRGGDIVGEHTVLFAGMGESLALSHRATDRGVFARGALRAAAWLESRPPGRYFMRDLFASKSGS